jgi:peptidoglycan hydrolase-like protein with peptidoglycan-binding domain
MTQFLDVEKKFVQRYPYKNDGVYRFQDMINKEMENTNYDDIEEIAKELRRIGYKVYWSNDVSNGKTKPNTYKTGSFIMSSAYAPQTKKQSQVVVDKGKKDELNKNNFNWVAAPTIEDAKNGKYIKYSMSGDSVGELQNKLNEKGNYNLVIDKKFGASTKNALIDFQKKNNITPAQGVFGPKTWMVLFRTIPQIPSSDELAAKYKITKPDRLNNLNLQGTGNANTTTDTPKVDDGTTLPQGVEGPLYQPDYKSETQKKQPGVQQITRSGKRK